MALATLGSVVFSVSSSRVFTPSNISGSAGSDWATHDVVHGKPRSEYVGPKLRSYTFDILLRAQDGVPPRRTLKTLQQMAESSDAYWFLVGGESMGDNPYKLTDITDSWDHVLSGGRLIQCKVGITLEEYL